MKPVFLPHITLDYLQRTFTEGCLPQTFGIQFSELKNNTLSAELTVDDRHIRPGGIANGGVFLILIETVGSAASSCAIDFEKNNTLGINVTANHLRSAAKGDKLTATAKPVHVGRSTHLWEVDIVNQNGQLISSGRITMMIIPKN
ncbi:MAG: PaaI family thioesterase [Bacteriovoracaceae bacterium]